MKAMIEDIFTLGVLIGLGYVVLLWSAVSTGL